ncbi:hypothetical protein BDN71DRAFT_1162861 [Pleurotus eryngii]|uniref:Uncharacterized protein n=1 Tax=Pleurotus eryngii TaxID=5323 RepID=A0A9P5ZV59_PLEER|nr:hypothetical protein BDN71DRAFT_1162861 [Pleurotus eryngii]
MSYMHLLVIPVARVYNAVALEDGECIEEMQAHFQTFWSKPDSKEKIIAAIDGTTDRKTTSLEERRKHLEEVLAHCQEYASHRANDLRKMNGKYNDYMGFHPHPTTSVGHLHMHVLLMENKNFLTYSTRAHDNKTIPASVVLKVINEKRNTSDKNPDIQSC